MSTEHQSKKTKLASVLDQLKTMTTIVADTGDFEGKFGPIFAWPYQIIMFIINCFNSNGRLCGKLIKYS